MRFAFLAALVLASCGVELAVAPGTEILCGDAGECPRGLACNVDAQRCVSEADAVPLLMTQVAATSSFEVLVVFNKPLVPSLATDVTRYAISPGIAIDGADIVDGSSVVLHTTELRARTYELRVSGLSDIYGYGIADADAVIEFPGLGDVVDPNPPRLLAPSDKANVPEATSIELRWTPVAHASRYVVTLALDAELTSFPPSAPADGRFVVDQAALQVDVEPDRAYFWKVTSDANEGYSSVSRFATVTSAVYVYCPPAAACSQGPANPAWEAGTRELPFWSAARAVTAAGLYEVRAVNVAGRDAEGYRDGVVLANPVTLLGGWDPFFTRRDVELWPTYLNADTLSLQIIANSGVITVDGFTVTSKRSGTSVLIANTDQYVTLSHSVLIANGEAALAIDTSSAPGPLIDDVRILGDVLVRGGAAPRFHQVVALTGQRFLFTGGAGGTLDDCRVEDATLRVVGGTGVCPELTISRSTLAARDRLPVDIELPACGDVRLTDNVVWGGSATAGSPELGALQLSGAVSDTPLVTLVHNTFVGASATDASHTIFFATPVSTVATNNLFVCVGHAVGIEQRDAGDALLSLENNGFVGCQVLLRLALNGQPNEDVTAEATLNGLDGSGTRHSRYGGNVVASLTTSEAFVDLDGVDGAIETIFSGPAADNDARLKLNGVGQPLRNEQLRLTSGGKNTTLSTCGSHDTPVPCGSVLIDRDGTARTNPPSLGAYEREP